MSAGVAEQVVYMESERAVLVHNKTQGTQAMYWGVIKEKKEMIMHGGRIARLLESGKTVVARWVRIVSGRY